MGYTHYFPHEKTTKKNWSAMKKDWRVLFENLPTKTDSAGGCYDEDLQIAAWDYSREGPWYRATSFSQCLDSEDKLTFNGWPDEMSHEALIIKKKGSDGFTFTKTACKPYDLMVCACLIVYMFHSSDTMELGSDGDWEAWGPALDFVEKFLGAEYAMKFRMEVEL